jgi:hypothetical protein
MGRWESGDAGVLRGDPFLAILSIFKPDAAIRFLGAKSTGPNSAHELR